MERDVPPPLDCDEPGCGEMARWLVLAVREIPVPAPRRAWTFAELAQAFCEAHSRGPRLYSGPRR